MYIQRNKRNGKICSVLLCSKYRSDGKVKTRTEANLSGLSAGVILVIENALRNKGESMVCLKDISVSSCMDYGYMCVLLHIFHSLRIDETLEKVLLPEDALLIKAMIIGKIITGGSKLCIFNWLMRESGICKLLGLDMSGRTVTDLYDSLRQLSVHQLKIEKKWFRYHASTSLSNRKGGQRRIYLYDITSTYFEGDKNELAAFGYNRDGKKGKKQLCLGLLTTEDGFPLRIQAFKGNTADSVTVADQILDLKREFGAEQIVFVGDRGMRILYNMDNDAELGEADIDFITGLTHGEINTLIEQGHIELNLFKRDLVEVRVDASTSLSNRDMRYILSINPELEAKELHYLDNCRDRVDALVEEIRKTWHKRCDRNRENRCKQEENPKKYKQLKTELTVKNIDRYKHRVSRAIEECGMGKYYSIETIDSEKFEITFHQEKFDRSRSLCGKYVVCTSVTQEEMTAEQVRGRYKNLQHVEHAFRDLKSDNISIRPVFHRREPQTRGHVLLCMFAYAIIKEMENKLFPFLKKYNSTHNTQLAFNDLTAELDNVKLCELKIGTGVVSLQKPELNPLQKNIFETLNIDPDKMIKSKDG
jgi:transposase